MADWRDDLFLAWLSGGLANAIASGVLNPFDVAKTRMQAQAGSSGLSLRDTLVSMYRSGGVIRMWTPGLGASAVREMLSSGPRVGFYIPARDFYKRLLSEEGEEGSACVLLAAITTGILGSVIANPIDVVKVRAMASPHAYPSITHALTSIVRNEGIVNGLYRGLVPSTLRGAAIAAGELGTYDLTKTWLKKHQQKWSGGSSEEGVATHVLASLITGMVAAVVAAPFDLLKTRAMNASNTNASLFKIANDVLRQEGGVLVLFRGVVPAYLRLGPHALICFPVLEQLRYLFGLGYF